MKALVTGGCGFIGSHLVDRLVKDGHEVSIVDTLVHPISGCTEWLIKNMEWNSVKFYRKDVSCSMKLNEDFDWIFHLAAIPRIQPSLKNPVVVNQVNVLGTLNILRLAEASNARLVYASSSSIYGNAKHYPTAENEPPDIKSPYSLSKYVSEIECRLAYEISGIQSTCLRFFNVYGPRQPKTGQYATVLGIFLNQKQQGAPLTIVGDGEQRRDFTHVSDVVEACVLAASKAPMRGEVINIGTGVNFSVNDIAELVGGPTTHLPERMGEYKCTLADNTKAEVLLGWKPKRELKEAFYEGMD